MWNIYLKQKKNKTVKEAGNSIDLLDKARFKRDVDYGDFKGLPRKTGSEKCLHNKAFSIAKNRKHNEYQRSLASMVYTFSYKNSCSDVKI